MADKSSDAERDYFSLDTRTVIALSLVILAVLSLVTALAVSRVFIVPVILAFLLALVFSGPCRFMRRRGVPEPLTAAGICAGLLVGVTAVAMALAMPVSEWVASAPEMARELEWKVKDLTGLAEAVAEAERQIEDATTAAADGEKPVKVVIDEQGPITTIALGAPLIVAQTVFVLILMYFILASGSLFYERLVRVLPTFADKRRAIQIAYDVEKEVSRYLLTITVINAGLGVSIGLALGLMGMPNPLAFGLVAFALNFVPFIGAIAGVALSFAVALLSLPTVWDAFMVAAVYFSLTSLEGQIITPFLVGRQLRMNTVVILISVAFWAWLWSIMGMIMAVPLLVTFRVICRHVEGLRAFDEFLSGRDE